MSFDVYFMAFKNGENCSAGIDGAWRVVEKYGYDRYGDRPYQIRLKSGESLQLLANGIDGNAEPFECAIVNLYSVAECDAEFLFELAGASRCAILIPSSSGVFIVDDAMRPDLPHSIRDEYPVSVVQDAGDLLKRIQSDLIGWSRLCDSIVEKLQDGNNRSSQPLPMNSRQHILWPIDGWPTYEVGADNLVGDGYPSNRNHPVHLDLLQAAYLSGCPISDSN